MESYNDILSCSRPFSRRVPMPVAHRAKQFAPFAALKGYEESVHDKEIRYETYRELSEERKEELDRHLRLLHYNDLVTATFFEQDSLQPNRGHYKTLTGPVERIDPLEGRMRVNHIDIDLKWLTDLEGPGSGIFTDSD